jgi:hypothetical protein
MNITITTLDESLAELLADRVEMDRAIDGLTAARSALEKLYGKTASAFPVEPPAIVPAETKRAGPKKRKSIDENEKRCKRCSRSAAEGATFFKHPAFADKLDNRCKQCRSEMRAEKEGLKAEPPAKEKRVHREERMSLPMKTPEPNNGPPIAHKCPSCPETFATMRALGIHQSRLHFSDRSMSGSSLGGM